MTSSETRGGSWSGRRAARKTGRFRAAQWLDGMALPWSVFDYSALTGSDHQSIHRWGVHPVRAPTRGRGARSASPPGFRLVHRPPTATPRPGSAVGTSGCRGSTNSSFAMFLQSGTDADSEWASRTGSSTRWSPRPPCAEPDRVVTVGRSMIKDCQQPIRYGMFSALIRPFGLSGGDPSARRAADQRAGRPDRARLGQPNRELRGLAMTDVTRSTFLPDELPPGRSTRGSVARVMPSACAPTSADGRSGG